MSEPLFPSAFRLDRSVEIGSVRLAFYDWPGARGPIICLPDQTASGRSFDELAEQLAPDWRVIAVDPRGRGGSNSPRFGSSHLVHVADVVAFIDTYGFFPAVLVGRGYGALISLLVAAWYPDLVAALVLLDGQPDSHVVTEGLGGLIAQENQALIDAMVNRESLLARIKCPTLVAPSSANGMIETLGFLADFPASTAARTGLRASQLNDK